MPTRQRGWSQATKKWWSCRPSKLPIEAGTRDRAALTLRAETKASRDGTVYLAAGHHSLCADWGLLMALQLGEDRPAIEEAWADADGRGWKAGGTLRWRHATSRSVSRGVGAGSYQGAAIRAVVRRVRRA